MAKEKKVVKPKPKQAKDIRSNVEPLERYPLGNGLEVWKVPTAMPIEQSVNARAMNSDMFMQLANNVASRGQLESLPFCALTDKGLELISGHHRTRAARKAEINEIWVLVDVSGISRDRLRAKQLAHNSIQGEDNDDMLRQIYASINDAEARLEAYINMDELKESDYSVKLTTADLELELETKTISMIFLPLQAELFKTALSELRDLQTDEVVVATLEEYDTMIKTMDKVSQSLKIQSVPTIIAKMSEIVNEYLNQLPKEEKK